MAAYYIVDLHESIAVFARGIKRILITFFLAMFSLRYGFMSMLGLVFQLFSLVVQQLIFSNMGVWLEEKVKKLGLLFGMQLFGLRGYFIIMRL